MYTLTSLTCKAISLPLFDTGTKCIIQAHKRLPRHLACRQALQMRLQAVAEHLQDMESRQMQRDCGACSTLYSSTYTKTQPLRTSALHRV